MRFNNPHLILFVFFCLLTSIGLSAPVATKPLETKKSPVGRYTMKAFAADSFKLGGRPQRYFVTVIILDSVTGTTRIRTYHCGDFDREETRVSSSFLNKPRKPRPKYSEYYGLEKEK